MLDVAIRGRIERADLPELCARACALLEGAEATVVRCDVSRLAADVVSLEALALLRLAARRRGCELRLHRASDELAALAAFTGLSCALGL